MGCELPRHVLPLLNDIPLEEVNDYGLIREAIATWREAERPDGEFGYSYKYIKNLLGTFGQFTISTEMRPPKRESRESESGS